MSIKNELSIMATIAALTDFIASGLERVGLSADDALRVARLMAQADQQGSDGNRIRRRRETASATRSTEAYVRHLTSNLYNRL